MLGRIGTAAVTGSTAAGWWPASRHRLGPGPHRDRRPQPARLRRGAARRFTGHDSRLPAARLALLRGPRHHDGADPHRHVAATGAASRRACDELGLGHRFTRPYRPQTRQGPADGPDPARGVGLRPTFSDTAERIALLPVFLDFYNRERPHWSLSGQSPISRTPVNNLTGRTPSWILERGAIGSQPGRRLCCGSTGWLLAGAGPVVADRPDQPQTHAHRGQQV